MAADKNSASAATHGGLTLAGGADPLGEIRAAYARGTDPSLASIARRAGLGPDSEQETADLIDADGRERLSRGLAVELDRYLSAFPHLPHIPCALDTAIEMSLRSLTAVRLMDTDAAVHSLSSSFPALRTQIETAKILGGMMCSTEGLRQQMFSPVRALPEDFGPLLKNGRRRYELREVLGTGSHGSVYLAADRQLSDADRPAWAAIKILNPIRSGQDEQARLADEAAKARRIDHANVVRVIDRGVAESREQYVVYEYVRGGNLDGYVAAQSDPMPTRKAASLVAAVSRGLQAAHAAGVAHCDLKPANIVMTEGGVPKIADFGIAVRVGDHGPQAGYPKMGNLAFTAPEQFRDEGRGATPSVDVYAAGGILYWLLCGEYPNGSSAEEVARNLRGAASRLSPPDPSLRRPIDGDLRAICMRALEPEARKRYQSADALADDLERWLGHTPLRWRRPSLGRRLRLLARREPRTVAAAGAAVLIFSLGVAGVVYLVQAKRQDRVAAELAASREQTAAAQTRLRDAHLATKAMISAMKVTRSEEEYLPVLTAIETMMGPVFFSAEPDSADLWSPRVEIVRRRLERARSEGRENDIEPMMWESVYGYWNLRLGELEEAEKVLSASRARWAALKPGDPWLVGLEALEAALQGKKALREEGPRRERMLLEAADRIESLDGESIAGSGKLIRQTVAEVKAELYGVSGLNNAARAEVARKELRALR